MGPGADTGRDVAQMEADITRSRALLENSIAVWRPLGDPVGLAMALATVVLTTSYTARRNRQRQTIGVTRDIAEPVATMTWRLAWRSSVLRPLTHTPGEISWPLGDRQQGFPDCLGDSSYSHHDSRAGWFTPHCDI